MRKPPAVATWLLRRFGVAERNAALVGDLSEAFQDGRSSTWYWRETAVAIANGLSHSVRASYLAGTVVGWAALVCVHALFWLIGSFRFRLHAGPFWFHFGVACAMGAAVAFIVKPWAEARDPSTPIVQVAGNTFFACLALDWCFSTFWNEPVSVDYLLHDATLDLVIALLYNLGPLIRGRAQRRGPV